MKLLPSHYLRFGRPAHFNGKDMTNLTLNVIEWNPTAGFHHLSRKWRYLLQREELDLPRSLNQLTSFLLQPGDNSVYGHLDFVPIRNCGSTLPKIKFFGEICVLEASLPTVWEQFFVAIIVFLQFAEIRGNVSPLCHLVYIHGNICRSSKGNANKDGSFCLRTSDCNTSVYGSSTTCTWFSGALLTAHQWALLNNDV